MNTDIPDIFWGRQCDAFENRLLLWGAFIGPTQRRGRALRARSDDLRLLQREDLLVWSGDGDTGRVRQPRNLRRPRSEENPAQPKSCLTFFRAACWRFRRSSKAQGDALGAFRLSPQTHPRKYRAGAPPLRAKAFRARLWNAARAS